MSIMTRVVTYLKEAVMEMKKVTWPTKKETQNYTILVIGVSLAVALYLGGLDYIFNWLLEKLLQWRGVM